MNYFVGNQSHSNIPTYEKVKYSGVYPGVDLVYYGNGGRLEHDFVVAPGADPAKISFRVDGATKLSLNAGGDLLLRTKAGEAQLQKPILYQEVDGARRTIPGGYVLEGIQVSFKVGAYDRNKPLIIDPVLVYSSYFAGNGYDQAFGVAVDGAGSAYITGFASSTNLATAGAYSTAGNGQASAYITKLNPQGTGAVYTTYLGGTTGPDEARAVAIDANGSAYVTGEACSADFPVSSSAFQRQGAGGCDAFVAKMSPDGSSLLYSTLLGGTDNDNGYAIAIDGTGNAYVTGGTCSAAIKYGESQIPYPTTPGAFQQESGGCTDAFITKVNSDGSGLVYSTYLGGSGSYEQGYGIAVDAQGSAYVTGEACSDNFPVTPGAFQTTATPACSAFVTKFNAAGTALIYSTLLGGSDNEVAWGIAVDSQGNAYVTGGTYSADFPTTPASYRPSGLEGAFVTKLNTTGSALVYSTFLDGVSSSDQGSAIALDSAGSAYVAGFKYSDPFGGDINAFVAKLNPDGSSLSYSTTFGGSASDFGYGIAVGASGGSAIPWATRILPTFQPRQVLTDHVSERTRARIRIQLFRVGSRLHRCRNRREGRSTGRHYHPGRSFADFLRRHLPRYYIRDASYRLRSGTPAANQLQVRRSGYDFRYHHHRDLLRLRTSLYQLQRDHVYGYHAARAVSL